MRYSFPVVRLEFVSYFFLFSLLLKYACHTLYLDKSDDDVWMINVMSVIGYIQSTPFIFF